MQEKRGCDLVDVLSYSFNLEVTLVKSSIEQVSLVLAEIFNGLIEPDIAIQEYGGRLHALIYQFKGQTWTLFNTYTYRNSLVQRVSKQLNTKCVHFGYGDTGGWAAYTLYNAGERVEAYAFGINYSDEEVPEQANDTNGFQDDPVLERDRPWNLVVVSPDEFRYKFFSVEQKATVTEVQNPNSFLDKLFQRQDAWLPALEYWFLPELNPDLNLRLLMQANAITYKPIV
jgi:hypothetical protein